MSGPYHIEIDNDGCKFCGQGKTWWVVGKDDSADSMSFGDEDDALDLCDKLNEAYEQGRNSVEPVPEGRTCCRHGVSGFECRLCYPTMQSIEDAAIGETS